MAKKTNYYYVLVLTMAGPVFVTGVGDHHTAYWDRSKPPMELSRDYAKDMVLGLNLNGHMAYSVVLPFELDTQPYRYDLGKFVWQMNETEGETVK